MAMDKVLETLPRMEWNVSSILFRIILVTPAFVVLYLTYRALLFLIKPHLSPLRKLKGPKPDSLVFGNMIEFATGDAYIRLCGWRAQYGDIFVLRDLFGDWRCVVADNKAIAHILANHMSYYKPESVRFQLSYLLGHGLVSAEGLEHRHQRRIMTPAFSASHLRSILPTFLDKSAAMSAMLRSQLDSAPMTSPDAVPSLRVDMITYLSRITLDIISAAGFNYDFDTLHQKPGEPGPELAGVLRRFLSPEKFPVFSFLKGFIPLLRLWEWDTRAHDARKARVALRRIGEELVDSGLKRASEEKASGGGTDLKYTAHNRDLLSLMIKSNMSTRVPPEQRLSFEQILNQIPTFLVAGHETTANSTAWCLYALCTHPTVQTRLREELLTTFPIDDSVEVTAEALNALPYLEAVVRETLRFHTPVEMTPRVAQGDDIIPLEKPFIDKHGKLRDCLEVKKGDAFIIPIMLMNRAKDLWGEDADEFNPDRWLSELPGTTAAIPGLWANLLTFLGGQRSCIGFKFAILEMKALLFHLLRDFEFQLAVKPEDIIPKDAGVTRPVVKFEKSKGSQLPVIIRPVSHN